MSASTAGSNGVAGFRTDEEVWKMVVNLKLIDSRLRSLTDEEISQTFSASKYQMIAPSPNDLKEMEEKGKLVTDVSSSEIDLTQPDGLFIDKFNELYRCQSAVMDGNFLVLLHGEWNIKPKAQPAFFVRQAYKDHWQIIEHHFVDERSTDRIIISGTPGGGKSVEGLYLIHRIFDKFSHNPPPILYAASTTSTSCLVYFKGFVFMISDHVSFVQSAAYKLMRANGPVWHVYDSTTPETQAGAELTGPQILISSPGKSVQNLKSLLKDRCRIIYLPLPSIEEMHIIRDNFFDEQSDTANYLSKTKMLDIILKFGCVPRTVFTHGNDSLYLEDIVKKLHIVSDIEKLLTMVGGTVVDHNVASGNFVHIFPYQRQVSSEEDEKDTKGERKRDADQADLDKMGLTAAENVNFLMAKYQEIIYIWASDYIRDQAFQVFLYLSADRMMTVILSHTHSAVGAFRGLLLEPFVHKLFHETGVVGRMRNLETGKEMGTIRLGPWSTKNVYLNHSQLKADEGVYNVPHKGNETAVDSLVPSEGYCFQTTSGESHGINRPGFDALMKTKIFDGYLSKSKPSKPPKSIQFVWITETKNYENFKKQSFHDKNKKAYAKDSPYRAYPGVVQMIFEVDMRRIYQFSYDSKIDKPINMTNKKKAAEIETAVDTVYKLKKYG